MAAWSWVGCDSPSKITAHKTKRTFPRKDARQVMGVANEGKWKPEPEIDNNSIIVRRAPGYFLFLWYCVLLIKEVAHMRDTLENLYFGNITPNDQIVKSGTALKKAMEQSAECEEKLTALLEDKEKTLLLRLINAENEIDSTMALENFILGFRLGVRMILEALDEDDGSLIDQNKEE